MAVSVPGERGIVNMIAVAIDDLLTQKLQTDIASSDLSRATVVKVGLEQEGPTYNTVLIHQNDPNNPQDWKHDTHSPLRMSRGGGVRASRSDPRTMMGREFVGAASQDDEGYHGGTLYERAFTVEVKTSLKRRIGTLSLTVEDVGIINEVVMSRIGFALRQGQYHIGTDQPIEDSFGEATLAGPFFGPSWADLEQGLSYKAIGYTRFWYLTYRP